MQIGCGLLVLVALLAYAWDRVPQLVTLVVVVLVGIGIIAVGLAMRDNERLAAMDPDDRQREQARRAKAQAERNEAQALREERAFQKHTPKCTTCGARNWQQAGAPYVGRRVQTTHARFQCRQCGTLATMLTHGDGKWKYAV